MPRILSALAANSILFMLLGSIPLFGQEDGLPQNPVIIVLDSYHTGFVWSDAETRGFLAGIREAIPGLDVPVEHLDMKRFFDQASQIRLKDFLVSKYSHKPVSLVVVLDNPAIELVGQYQKELFPGIPVVFAGISNYENMRMRRPHMTGVAEIQDITNTLKLALALHPGANEVMVLDDYTTTGISARAEAEAVYPEFRERVKFTFLPPSTWEEAQGILKTLSADTIVLIHSYSTDRLGRSLSLSESTRILTEGVNAPVYGTHETRLGSGIVGGFLLSGEEHGRRAAAIAMRVLSGEAPDGISVDTDSTTRSMFDHNVLVKFGIREEQLPRQSIVINRPDDPLSRYFYVVVIALGIISLLATLVVLLVVSVVRLRQVEVSLRESEKNHRSVIENIQDIFYRSDEKARLLMGSPSGARIFGYDSIESMIGLSLDDFWIDKGERARILGEIRTNGSVTDFEAVLKKKDGTTFNASLTAHAYFSLDGKYLGTEGIIRDITERKRAEEERELLQRQFLHSQKMEAVGRLAGGIAHDFNNTLSVIMNFTELAKTRIPQDHPVAGDLAEILSAGTRTASLVRQLLAFSRRQAALPRVVDINRLIADSAKLLARLLGEDVEFVIAVESDTRPVKIDPSQVDQILANLAVNARDAMPDGGTFRIHASNVAFDDAFCGAHRGAVKGDYVRLEISDTGVGMDQNVLSHAFEPFFTTKDTHLGTGLGLATVYGIVKQWNGFINVTSAPGSGTVFSVYLPCHDGKVEAEPAAVQAADCPGTETILMVEDEAQILTASSIFLKRNGYTLITASGPGEALEKCREHEGAIDLLVTDIIMPGMDGREMAEKIVNMRPGTRVLFMSGYTADVILNHGVIDEGAGFIQKPFMIKSFLSKIREVLDQDRPH